MMVSLAVALSVGAVAQPQLACERLDFTAAIQTFFGVTHKLYPESRTALENQLHEAMRLHDAEPHKACGLLSNVRNSLARQEGPRVLSPTTPDPLSRTGAVAFCKTPSNDGPVIDKLVKKHSEAMYPRARQQLQKLLRAAAAHAVDAPQEACVLYDEVRAYLVDLELPHGPRPVP